jgi:hypothetical protein
VYYGLGRPFDYDPLDAILRWERAGDWEALEKKLRGRPVIVGAIGEGTARRPTPIPLAGWEPGASDSPELMAHAQALRTLIGGVPQLGAPWLTLVLVVLAAGVGGSARRPLVGAIGVGAALLALWFLELWLLDRSLWLPPSGPVVALVLGWLLPTTLARA